MSKNVQALALLVILNEKNELGMVKMRLNIRDLSELLNVSEKTIRRWIKQGSIPAYRINGQYRFNQNRDS